MMKIKMLLIGLMISGCHRARPALTEDALYTECFHGVSHKECVDRQYQDQLPNKEMIEPDQ